MSEEESPPSDKIWSFEDTIKVEKDRLKLYFRLAIFNDPPSITSIKKDFATVCNCFNFSKSRAVTVIFLVGLRVLVDACGLEDNLFDSRYLARQEKLSYIKQKQQEQADLRQIYKELGVEGFKEWCQETKHNADDFLCNYTLALNPNKSDSIAEFLVEFLSDNELHSTDDIKTSLVRNGIIEDDSGWQYAKTVANREGYTKNTPRGYWKISS